MQRSSDASISDEEMTSKDLLRELLNVARSIQASLDKETVPKSEEVPTEAYQAIHANLSRTDAIVEESSFVWPTTKQKDDVVASIRAYKSGCENMVKELDYLIDHYRIVGQINNKLEASEHLKEIMLNTAQLQLLENALSQATSKSFKETYESLEDALRSFQFCLEEVRRRVGEFRGSLGFQMDDVQVHNFSYWIKLTSDGQDRINEFFKKREMDECLKYLHSELLQSFGTAMQGVAKELSALERNSVNAWLTLENSGEFEQWCNKYIGQVLARSHRPQADSAWKDKEVGIFRERCKNHTKIYKVMDEKLLQLIVHYQRIGGDEEVTKASQFLKDKLHAPMETIEFYLSTNPHSLHLMLPDAAHRLGNLHFAAYKFQKSLYRQEHAFYFHYVEKWTAILWDGWREIARYIRDDKPDKCLEYMQKILFPSLESTIAGIGKELDKFRTESLPSFLTEEKERDASLYVSITGIATFFSSVTATTLQYSFQQSRSTLGAAVNLFWFLSLVFSVSSGISSLLGLAWRKSSIYHTSSPPKPIRMWLDKAPMFFLIIAAFAFIGGLNLFAFLSSQPLSVSLTTVAFTVLHIFGLFIVIAWFVLELKQNNVLAKWILHPYQQYKSKLQLQREFFWAFGFEKEVGRLTYEMSSGITNARPKPSRLSRLIRCLRSSLKRHTSGRFFSHRRSGVDTDAEGAGARPREEERAQPSSQAEEVKREFRKTLVDKFGDAELVNEVLKTIRIWENPYVGMSEEWEDRIKLLLWGYPKLVKEVEEKVLSVLRKQKAENIETDAKATNNGPPEIVHAYGVQNGHDGLQPLGVYFKPRPVFPELTYFHTLTSPSASNEQAISREIVDRVTDDS